MHLVQRSALRSHFALAVEQCRQAFCREVAYLEAFMLRLYSQCRCYGGQKTLYVDDDERRGTGV